MESARKQFYTKTVLARLRELELPQYWGWQNTSFAGPFVEMSKRFLEKFLDEAAQRDWDLCEDKEGDYWIMWVGRWSREIGVGLNDNLRGESFQIELTIGLRREMADFRERYPNVKTLKNPV